MDAETETILFQKAADERMPPASMAKLMTVAVVFDAIKTGKLSLDTEFQVSENAWRNGGANSGGSTMFAKLGSTIKVADLCAASSSSRPMTAASSSPKAWRAPRRPSPA